MLGHWQDKQATLFAVRVGVSVIATWLVCLRFDMHATSAAMISVITILMAGSYGAGLVKSAARAAGTIAGGIFIVSAASATLIDPWLYCGALVLWIVICIGLASYYHGSLAYAFSLAGMTAAVVGFPVALSPDIFSVFDYTQSRCIGILLGIAVVMVVTAILPFDDDAQRIKPIKQATFRLIELMLKTAKPEQCQVPFNQFLTLVTRNKQLPIDMLFGSNAPRDQIKSQADTLFHCASLAVSTIRLLRMIAAEKNEALLQKIAQAVALIKQGETDTALLYRQVKVSGSVKTQIIDQQVQQLIANLIWLKNDSLAIDKDLKNTRIDQFLEHPDSQDMLLNMLRATLVLGLISLLWLEGGWENGMNAMVFAGILCAMTASAPNAGVGSISVIKAQPVAILFGFILTFAIAPLGSPLLFFGIVFVFLLLVSYEFFVSKTANKQTWMYLLLFWSSYAPKSNIPVINFSDYVNVALASLIAAVLFIVFYRLIPERSDLSKALAAIKKEIKHQVNKGLSRGGAVITSNFILSVYPVLMANSAAQVHLYRLIVLAELLRLNELGLLDEADKHDVSEMTSRVLSGNMVPISYGFRAKVDKRLAELDGQLQADQQAYSAWWQLQIALNLLSEQKINRSIAIHPA